VLARLDQVEGVERSFTDYTGTLIRLSLRSGADPQKVAAAVTRVLHGATAEGSVVRLTPEEATAAVQAEEWRDLSRVGELSTIEWRTLGRRALLAVVGILGALGLGIVWRRRRLAQRAP
jgi:hypothetical protein